MVESILDGTSLGAIRRQPPAWEFIVVLDRVTHYQTADAYNYEQMEQKREMDLAVRGRAKMTGDGFRHARKL